MNQNFPNPFTSRGVPAEAADFVFNRLEYLQQGEAGVFDVGAPPPWEFHDLCTLTFFIANKEIAAAHELVSSLLQPPSVMLPSATLTTFNNNYLKALPFRRRKKRRAATHSTRPSQVWKSLVFLLIMYYKKRKASI